MDDDMVDALLVRSRHRDAVRILVVSLVVGLPLLVATAIGVEWGSFWDPILTSVLGFAVFAGGTAALHLRRDRQVHARAVRFIADAE